MQLTRQRITEAALRILVEYGLADVSMRRVASSLGVAPGALYWHISSKQELIACMGEAIVQQLLDGPLPDPVRLSTELRGAVLGVRDGAEVVIAALSQPHARVQGNIEARFTASVQAAVKASVGEAASASDARIVGQALLHLTLGSAAVHQSAAQLAQATGPADTGGADVDEAAGAAEHAAAVGFLLGGLERTG